MSYRTRIRPLVRNQIARWGLTTRVLVEVYLRLNETLPSSPTSHLIPVGDDRAGMLYYFQLIDPENRFRVHPFAFRVLYGQDE